MTSHDNTSDVPLSNWTLATGTKPGERYVYPAVLQQPTPRSTTGARS